MQKSKEKSEADDEVKTNPDMDKIDEMKERSCQFCGHFTVCEPHRENMRSMAKGYGLDLTGDRMGAPFHPFDLARICHNWLPLSFDPNHIVGGVELEISK